MWALFLYMEINYGNRLQGYAVQHVLKQIGIDSQDFYIQNRRALLVVEEALYERQ